MIEGHIGDMIQRNRARQDFHAPPYLADRRPLALSTGGTVIALTCSDPRLDPRKILVLDGTPGPVVSVIRVPGGRASLAIKALAGMQAVLGSGTILVIHHTDCGMTHVTDEEVREHLRGIVPEDEKESIQEEQFGEIRGSLETSITEDIKVLRTSTWIKKNTRLIGLKYNTHTGIIDEVDDFKPENWPGTADARIAEKQTAV